MNQALLYTLVNIRTFSDILHDEPGSHVSGSSPFRKVITGVGKPLETQVNLTSVESRRQPNEDVRLTKVGGTIRGEMIPFT